MDGVKYVRALRRRVCCLSFEGPHGNIARSMAHFLAGGKGAEVWVVSGFFLGREKLVGFFDVAAREGLDVREVFEQNAVGEGRAWMVDRAWRMGERLWNKGEILGESK